MSRRDPCQIWSGGARARRLSAKNIGPSGVRPRVVCLVVRWVAWHVGPQSGEKFARPFARHSSTQGRSPTYGAREPCEDGLFIIFPFLSLVHNLPFNPSIF